jgi:hypothetical protein
MPIPFRHQDYLEREASVAAESIETSFRKVFSVVERGTGFTAEYRLEVVEDAGRYITTCAAVAASIFNEVNRVWHCWKVRE